VENSPGSKQGTERSTRKASPYYSVNSTQFINLAMRSRYFTQHLV